MKTSMLLVFMFLGLSCQKAEPGKVNKVEVQLEDTTYVFSNDSAEFWNSCHFRDDGWFECNMKEADNREFSLSIFMEYPFETIGEGSYIDTPSMEYPQIRFILDTTTDIRFTSFDVLGDQTVVISRLNNDRAKGTFEGWVSWDGSPEIHHISGEFDMAIIYEWWL